MRRCSRCRKQPVPIQSELCADCLYFQRGLGAVIIMFIVCVMVMLVYVNILIKFNP